MGFFSWKTSDTNQSVGNRYQSAVPLFEVKMIDDKGNEWYEKSYEGYGVFGGKNFYKLTCEMNEVGDQEDKENDENRSAGIELAFSKRKEKLPKIVTADCKTPWENLPESEECEYQGFFYGDCIEI